ncbi:DUF447 domain-containing protein [Halobaculum sp. MBLA0147]|uniref:DUF447 domain-containing protein n=1 Tax=Halobaculum sp. MBLA0147 TaxID=3079934 RepID=UPI0035239D34
MDGDGDTADADAEWPVALTGVTETVVTTLGPNDLWNVAALGVHAPAGGGDDHVGAGEGDDPDGVDDSDSVDDADGVDDPDDGYDTAWARTWGRTRTWRNFRERGEGVVQFTVDPLTFAEAALTIREESDPVVESADAWVRVAVERVAAGERGGTQWVDWRLHPVETEIRRERVGSFDRAALAVVEATVAASRLDVPTYDTDALLDRLAFYDEVVETAGGDRARRAFDVVDDATGWRSSR